MKENILKRNQRETIGLCVDNFNLKVSKVAKKFNQNYATIYYHAKRKRKKNNCGTKKWGGNKKKKFTKETNCLIESSVYYFLKNENTLELKDLKKKIEELLQIQLSCSFIQRILSSWHWTKKKISNMGFQKFNEENLEYYETFMKTILSINPLLISYIDEAHVVDKVPFFF